MAQHDYNIANQGFSSFRSDLNNALSAIQTTNSGTSRPTGAVAGQLWLDTTTASSPTLKYYDGADDISLATIDHSANTVNWLDSTVSITGLSTTATGTVLTLSDSANTTTVNLILDNQKEIRFRETTANGTNYVALKAPASLSADVTYTLPVAPTSNNQALISSTAGVIAFTPYALPTSDGTANQVLTTNGSGVLSFATSSSGISWQSSVKTSGFTATAGEGYFCNTTSAGFTVTLPATPTAGNQIALIDYAGTFDTNFITISPNGNKIEGSTSNMALRTEREGVLLVYIDATQGWLATSGINEGTDSLEIAPYTVDFLVIAGGGGSGGSDGGSTPGGAGGAGGYRNSFSTETSGGGGSSEASLTFNIGTVYTVTVGAGGSGGNTTGGSDGSKGITGSNSEISGTGITTITSSGGGGGAGIGGGSLPGRNGGSGGGGNLFSAVGTGTANQGYDGGRNASLYSGSSGGGGGAGGAGQGQTAGQNGGTGGVGLSSSITGSSVSRGGGGGGSGDGTGTGGTATAGGGSGGGSGGSGNAGTANTGGGGGGRAINSSGTGNSGGSGVVILRIPTANYSGTTTGSPTVTTDGSDKVIVFTGSGTITG